MWGDHRLDELFIDSGGAVVRREFSSGFEEDGERRKMDVWEDFEGIVELEEVDKELQRPEFTNKNVIEERMSVEEHYLEMGSSNQQSGNISHECNSSSSKNASTPLM
jgi:hypothetical protein